MIFSHYSLLWLLRLWLKAQKTFWKIYQFIWNRKLTWNILHAFVIMILIFVYTGKSSSPLSMTYNPTKFSCILNEKIYSSEDFSGFFSWHNRISRCHSFGKRESRLKFCLQIYLKYTVARLSWYIRPSSKKNCFCSYSVYLRDWVENCYWIQLILFTNVRYTSNNIIPDFLTYFIKCRF